MQGFDRKVIILFLSIQIGLAFIWSRSKIGDDGTA